MCPKIKFTLTHTRSRLTIILFESTMARRICKDLITSREKVERRRRSKETNRKQKIGDRHFCISAAWLLSFFSLQWNNFIGIKFGMFGGLFIFILFIPYFYCCQIFFILLLCVSCYIHCLVFFHLFIYCLPEWIWLSMGVRVSCIWMYLSAQTFTLCLRVSTF